MTIPRNLSILARGADSSGVLGVTNGGTGATTLASNNVLLGNGTSALQSVAPGSNGNVLTSNGTTWTSSAPATPATAQIQTQLFTSSGTWTAPTGVTKVRLTVIGGGGGGAANGCTGWVGGYGGFGYGIYTVTPGTTYTVTVGAAGAGSAGAGNGSAGGTSSFGALLSATGGAGATSGADGASGSAASANFRNLNVGSLGYPTPWGGVSTVTGTTPPAAAQTWSISSIYAPGAAGSAVNNGSRGIGGYSGIIFVEWVA